MKVAVCAIAKNENRYIVEWVNWYKKLGFSKICIFDNNDLEDECIKDVLNEDDIVEINETYINKNDKFYQSECYTKFYNEHKTLYDWILFCDIDEFLVLERHKTIQEFLSSNKKFDNFDAIAICWKIYDDNDLIYYDDRAVVERFTHPSQSTKNNSQIKSLIRCMQKHLKIFAHGTNSAKYCDVLGNEAKDLKFPRLGNYYIHEQCWINHYRFKTIEEFILSKYKNFNQEHIHSKYINFDSFFVVNKLTEEKLNVIKEFGLIYEHNI